MSSEVIAETAAMATFSATMSAIGAAIGGAGGVSAAVNTATLIPVFGVIGQEFLGAFIGAQSNNLFAVAEVSAAFAGTAAATAASAASYTAHDFANGQGIQSALVL